MGQESLSRTRRSGSPWNCTSPPRIQGVGPNRAAQLVGKHGAAVLDILNGNSGDSMRMLTAIPGIGTKTAEKMMRSWVLNQKKSAYLRPVALQIPKQLSYLCCCFLGSHALST